MECVGCDYWLMQKAEEVMVGVEITYFEKAKPALIMTFPQISFATMNVITKMALNRGISFFLLVFYRHVVATIAITPFAYFWER